MIKAFLSAIKLPGKSKFKHFLYDLSLRIAIVVTLYTLCLFTSLIVPLTNFFAVLFFTATVSIFSNDVYLVHRREVQLVLCIPNRLRILEH